MQTIFLGLPITLEAVAEESSNWQAAALKTNTRVDVKE